MNTFDREEAIKEQPFPKRILVSVLVYPEWALAFLLFLIAAFSFAPCVLTFTVIAGLVALPLMRGRHRRGHHC